MADAIEIAGWAGISAGWRIHWRTSAKVPANKLFRNGLESR
jgi:hypothetical protein